MAFAIEEAHKRGLELHGWMNPYRYENSSTTHSSNDYILRDHPSWVIRVGQESILNPGLAAVRTHIAQVTAEVVRNYPEIDGIVWDDYFYLSSISNQDSESFANNNAQGLSLSDWRRDYANKTMQELDDIFNGI